MGRRSGKRPLFSSDAARAKEGYGDIRKAFFPSSRAKEKENRDDQHNQNVGNRCTAEVPFHLPLSEISQKSAIGFGQQKKHRHDGINESATTTDLEFASAQPVAAASKQNDTEEEESVVASKRNDTEEEESVVATFSNDMEMEIEISHDLKPPAKKFHTVMDDNDDDDDEDDVLVV